MTTREIHIAYQCCEYAELSVADRQLVDAARQACASSYAPYSKFNVGAAVRLADGQIVEGSNQENAAYPSGICAERCALFAANAKYPQTPVVALAIAAKPTGGDYVEQPVSPCGACRQVALETQMRFNTPIRWLLCGKNEVFIVNNVCDLLPLHF